MNEKRRSPAGGPTPLGGAAGVLPGGAERGEKTVLGRRPTAAAAAAGSTVGLCGQQKTSGREARGGRARVCAGRVSAGRVGLSATLPAKPPPHAPRSSATRKGRGAEGRRMTRHGAPRCPRCLGPRLHSARPPCRRLPQAPERVQPRSETRPPARRSWGPGRACGPQSLRSAARLTSFRWGSPVGHYPLGPRAPLCVGRQPCRAVGAGSHGGGEILLPRGCWRCLENLGGVRERVS